MNDIDTGVPILNMHPSMELAHTNDILSTFRCYKKFLTLGVVMTTIQEHSEEMFECSRQCLFEADWPQVNDWTL